MSLRVNEGMCSRWEEMPLKSPHALRSFVCCLNQISRKKRWTFPRNEPKMYFILTAFSTCVAPLLHVNLFFWLFCGLFQFQFAGVPVLTVVDLRSSVCVCVFFFLTFTHLLLEIGYDEHKLVFCGWCRTSGLETLVHLVTEKKKIYFVPLQPVSLERIHLFTHPSNTHTHTHTQCSDAVIPILTDRCCQIWHPGPLTCPSLRLPSSMFRFWIRWGHTRVKAVLSPCWTAVFYMCVRLRWRCYLQLLRRPLWL